jgi:hypothetical protein
MEHIGASMLRYIARLRVLRARIIRRHAAPRTPKQVGPALRSTGNKLRA